MPKRAAVSAPGRAGSTGNDSRRVGGRRHRGSHRGRARVAPPLQPSVAVPYRRHVADEREGGHAACAVLSAATMSPSRAAAAADRAAALLVARRFTHRGTRAGSAMRARSPAAKAACIAGRGEQAGDAVSDDVDRPRRWRRRRPAGRPPGLRAGPCRMPRRSPARRKHRPRRGARRSRLRRARRHSDAVAERRQRGVHLGTRGAVTDHLRVQSVDEAPRRAEHAEGGQLPPAASSRR